MLAHVLCLVAACHAWPSYGGLRDPGSCNPLNKDSRTWFSYFESAFAHSLLMHVSADCSPDSAFAGKSSFKFEGASYNEDFEKFWIVDDETKQDRDRVKFGDGNGLQVSLTDQKQAPTLTSHQYLLFGKVTVRAKAAKGPGLVTTVVLKSDSGDEIDWEMLGAFQNQAQSNYYYNGEPLFNTYNTTYAISSSSYDDFHDYTVEWTDKFLKFSIDGAERKTWQPGEIPADKWPQTPMQVKLGIWAVEGYNDPGEISWAGGVPDWSRQPFTAAFHSVEVEDYTGWCEQVDAGGPVEYQYDDKTESWADVRVAGCRERREPGITAPAPSGTSSAPSSASATETDNAEPTDNGDDNNGDGNPDDNEGAASILAPSAFLAFIAGLGSMLFF
ncbi:hypothetical protein LLEC1_04659 [Akanthomyces lecanii]|uniref:GH16 domain-containing protein n=1 Tax=Cordyceps confragosa TaxID=2714763 RepID=A0A179IQR2_CORDF|nr:hypothetical protein LLEC1_04659 [Akanthomyces lecanii]